MKPFVNLLENIVQYNNPTYRKPLTILEIGVHKGVSTNAFLHALLLRHRKGDKLYSIDKRDVTYSPPIEELGALWELIKGDSARVPWDKEIDILLIDGNHTYKYVKGDYEKFEPFVRKNGIILLHDMVNHKYDGPKYWTEIKYPKIILDMGRNGMGIVTKT